MFKFIWVSISLHLFFYSNYFPKACFYNDKCNFMDEILIYFKYKKKFIVCILLTKSNLTLNLKYNWKHGNIELKSLKNHCYIQGKRTCNIMNHYETLSNIFDHFETLSTSSFPLIKVERKSSAILTQLEQQKNSLFKQIYFNSKWIAIEI